VAVGSLRVETWSVATPTAFFRPTARVMRSNIPGQFSDTDFEGAGNSPQRSQRNVLLAALDPAHVIGVKAGLFGQLLLAESGARPLFTDGCAKDDTIIKTRPHPHTQPQTCRALYTAKRMILSLHWRPCFW